MRKAVIVINNHSGSKRGTFIDKEKLISIFSTYNYEVAIYITKYKKNATEIIKSLKDDIDLVISVGGDGTFNEIVTGNLERKHPLIISHIPFGTTNDIGAMFSLGKNPEKNLRSILDGSIRKIDLCSVNGHPFVYVAGFGKFMNIPYETPRKLKKKIGYFAYLYAGIRDFFTGKTHLYNLTFEVNGEKHTGLYSFILISNANRIAGISNFYKDVKLDDKKFEVLLCSIKKKKDIIKSLVELKTGDIKDISGFNFYRTDKIKITFHEPLKKAWCIDGEKYPKGEATYVVKVIPDVPIMLPKKINKELFENGED